MLTARTLYTYKYEVAINNDKVHRPAFSFLSRDLLWNVTFRRVSRGAHLSGRPEDTSPPPYTGAPGDTLLWKCDAGGWLGRVPSYFDSQSAESWDWCVRRSFFWFLDLTE